MLKGLRLDRILNVVENTKYFHGVMNKRRRQMAIRVILVDGDWIDSFDRVKREFLTFCFELFNHSAVSRLSIEVEFLNKLSSDHVIRPF